MPGNRHLFSPIRLIIKAGHHKQLCLGLFYVATTKYLRAGCLERIEVCVTNDCVWECVCVCGGFVVVAVPAHERQGRGELWASLSSRSSMILIIMCSHSQDPLDTTLAPKDLTAGTSRIGIGG